ncbi:hypothetical protein PG991_005745 [Apiospora marii]|uniref:C2H2-type domain-containing protein n=1 Tax=Apiospora marii TaxID=335849 RepID=A0ABR1SA40_9PEZI
MSYQCGTCGRRFDSHDAREQHGRANLHPTPGYKCDTCERSFPLRSRVEDHMDSTGHWYNYDESKRRDIDDDKFCVCGTCGRWFSSFEPRDRHMDELNHEPPEFECNTCEMFFSSKREVEEHMTSEGHWDYTDEDESTYGDDAVDSSYDGDDTDSYACDLCHGSFATEEECIKHEAFAHRWCYDCVKYFPTVSDAWVHRARLIKCAFCNRHFASATTLCAHLERNGCRNRSNITDKQIYELVCSKVPDCMHSKNPIKWNEITYEANALAWNGSAYECCLCRKRFSTLPMLNGHLRSPVHQDSLYHCPKKHCFRGFMYISSVMNHLESESCGLMRSSNPY